MIPAHDTAIGLLLRRTLVLHHIAQQQPNQHPAAMCNVWLWATLPG